MSRHHEPTIGDQVRAMRLPLASEAELREEEADTVAKLARMDAATVVDADRWVERHAFLTGHLADVRSQLGGGRDDD